MRSTARCCFNKLKVMAQRLKQMVGRPWLKNAMIGEQGQLLLVM